MKFSAFTLLELLVVIAIISILASMLLPVVQRAREEGRKTVCLQNLRQFCMAIMMYKDDWNNQFPPWLSNLYPSYISNSNLYVCPSDGSKGTEGGKPDWQPEDQFAETDDISSNTHPARNPQISVCSYLYEFCIADCSWNPGYTWKEAKIEQMQTYAGTKIPIVRCFWHTKPPLMDNTDIVINIAYDGNITISGPAWEDTTR